MGRKRQHTVELTDRQVCEIQKLIKSKKTTTTRVGRLRILLLLDSNHNDTLLGYQKIAERLGVSRNMVVNVVNSYTKGGLEKVLHIKRSPNSDVSRKKLDGRAEAKLLEIACGEAPEGRAKWSLRLLAEKAKVVLDIPVGKDTIQRALKKTNFDLTKTGTGASPKKSPHNS